MDSFRIKRNREQEHGSRIRKATESIDLTKVEQRKKELVSNRIEKKQTLTLVKGQRRRALPGLSSLAPTSATAAHQRHLRCRYAGARDGPALPLVGARHRAGLRACGCSGKGTTANPLDGGALPLGRARAPAKGAAPPPIVSSSGQRAAAVHVWRERKEWGK